MKTKEQLRDFLESRKICKLDGAIGTCLEQQGHRTSLPLWTAMSHLEAPDAVTGLHQAYIDAGADIISANTWRASYYLFEKVGCLDRLFHCIEQASVLGRDAWEHSDTSGLLGGSIAPLEDCYQPSKVPKEGVLMTYHDRQLEVLAKCDFDLVLAETIGTLREAMVLVQLAQKKDIPITISLVTDGNTNLLSGEPLADAIDQISLYEPLAILLNCRSLTQMENGAKILAQSKPDLIKGLYPNAPGKPDPVHGWIADQDSVQTFKQWMKARSQEGFSILGGCCGTTPAHITSIST